MYGTGLWNVQNVEMTKGPVVRSGAVDARGCLVKLTTTKVFALRIE